MNHPFTETYIAMAEAAVEIQAMRSATISWVFGDWSIMAVYGESDDGIVTPMVQCFGGTAFDGLDYPLVTKALAFLPRLDQLLGMLGNPEEFRWAAVKSDSDGGGYCFYRDEDAPWVNDWHELALATVMYEKYSKRWRGKEWVKV